MKEILDKKDDSLLTSSGIPAAAFLDPFHSEHSAPPVVLSQVRGATKVFVAVGFFCSGPHAKFVRNPPRCAATAQVFNPADLLAGDPAGWCSVLRALSPKLPVQLHCEPFNIRDGPDPASQPIFRNAVAMLSSLPELAELMNPTMPTGEPRRARIKFRLATAGKFIHRNRFQRRQILCCLSGQQEWLLMSSAGGGADALLQRSTNDNWNGFRSQAHPSMLSVEEMHALAAAAPPGVTARLVTFRAGDVMAFDGRWWHATSYSTPVLNMFFTPGDDMEVAVKEHKRRMAMPMQKDLQLCTVSMAKCSKLSAAWTTAADGKSIDWTGVEGHIALPTVAAPASEKEEAAAAKATAEL